MVVSAALWHDPLVFAVLPVLMVAACRGGVRSVGIAGLGVAFAAYWATVTGRADHLTPAAGLGDSLVEVQLFVAVTLVAALALAAEVCDGRRTARELGEVERERGLAELAALDAADAERRRIAREIHDIVGHALNVVLLQAGAARRSLGRDAVLTGNLLTSIEAVGRDAFEDLDVAIGLADRVPDVADRRGIGDVPELVAMLHRAGVAVELDLARRTPDRLDARRLVRLPHRPGVAHQRAQARAPGPDVGEHRLRAGPRPPVDRRRRLLAVPAVPAVPAGSPGRGLIGIRERTSHLGGHIESGPQPDGGYTVVALLPFHGRRA